MKRLLFLIHRWAGVALALFMLLWFISGLVIVYSTQMTQTRAQQWAKAESLRPEAGWLSLGEAWKRSADARANSGNKPAGVLEARLARIDGQPVWLVEDIQGQRFALSALDGGVRRFTPQDARGIAGQWINELAGHSDASPVFAETLESPTILRNQEAFKPFHRVILNDGAGGELLISARTGEVIHASTSGQRAMYWAGNWVHLFRFLDLAGWGDKRADVLLWLAGAAFAATLIGLIVGWLRWRPGWFGKATYAEGRVHPYKVSWFRWHFWAGLIGGIAALTWTLSAYFNGNPGQLFSPANPTKAELARYAGKEQPKAMLDWSPDAAYGLSPDVVELNWRRLGGEAVLFAYHRDGSREQLIAKSPAISSAEVDAAVARLAGDVPVVGRVLQTEYDSYYYPRHGRGTGDRPLPALKLTLGDSAATSFYVDPFDGRLLLRQDQSRRVYRWLWSALHHWDFGWLYQRPLWDAWMLTWIGFGLVLSVTSVVLGWRRLKATFKRKKAKTVLAPRPATLATEGQGG